LPFDRVDEIPQQERVSGNGARLLKAPRRHDTIVRR
jgi:hypothetical protein